MYQKECKNRCFYLLQAGLYSNTMLAILQKYFFSNGNFMLRKYLKSIATKKYKTTVPEHL